MNINFRVFYPVDKKYLVNTFTKTTCFEIWHYQHIDSRLNSDLFLIEQLWREWKGVKIFVGDIVQIGHHLRLIRFDEENARFCFINVSDLKHEDWKDSNQAPEKEWFEKYADNIKVLGNINQNPELLSV